MKELENCILLGDNIQVTHDNYQLVLQITGIGQLRTIMSPEEYAVISDVFTRMLADFYLPLYEKDYTKYNVYRIESE